MAETSFSLRKFLANGRLRQNSAARIHHVMWSFPAKFRPKNARNYFCTWRLWAFKTSILASRDVMISSQICVSKFQSFFTLGDGCWLPKTSLAIANAMAWCTQLPALWWPCALYESLPPQAAGKHEKRRRRHVASVWHAAVDPAFRNTGTMAFCLPTGRNISPPVHLLGFVIVQTHRERRERERERERERDREREIKRKKRKKWIER